jgi:hypothetical protein
MVTYREKLAVLCDLDGRVMWGPEQQ